jgi:AraC-like DNA-binding protein
MAELDALFRGAAIGIALLLAISGWHERPSKAFAWTGSFYSAAVIAFLLVGSSGFMTWRPIVRLALGTLALSAPFLFWAQTRLVFDDAFRLRRVHWLWLLVIEISGVLGIALRSDPNPWLHEVFDLAFRATSIGLVGQALWLVWQGRGSDLVEVRARSRVALVLISGLTIAGIIIVAILSGPTVSRPPDLKLVESTALLVLTLAFGAAFLRLERGFLPLPSPALGTPPRITLRIPQETNGPEAGSSESVDQSLLTRLETAMSRDEVWRETGLTIGVLATRVGAPEYRVRRLINQRLGFRNFTSFVNEYRLSAAAARLADPAELRVPILTIALELGWGSIGPFNRAFRARFGVPPSDYRRARLQPGADRPLADS